MLILWCTGSVNTIASALTAAACISVRMCSVTCHDDDDNFDDILHCALRKMLSSRRRHVRGTSELGEPQT